MFLLPQLHSWYDRLIAGAYDPTTVVLISRERLLGNLAIYRRRYPTLAFAPVLKSNAYGHGLVLVANLLETERLPFFVVDSLYEARLLRRHGVRTPLLIIGYVSAENIARSKLRNIAFTVTSLTQLADLARLLRRPQQLHLKIDTGMHRQGILVDELETALNILTASPLLSLQGVCSHLADADSGNGAHTTEQLKRWRSVLSRVEQRFPRLMYRHLPATAGLRHVSNIDGNLARLGLGLYGIDTSPEPLPELQPVLQMETVVSGAKHISAGAGVGYNVTYRAEHDMTIATLPVGYFEGIDRRLSNCGVVTIRGITCPIVGRVSMNITTIDATQVPDVKLNERVVVVSRNPSTENSVVRIAHSANTIPYEILVHIPQHLRRVVA